MNAKKVALVVVGLIFLQYLIDTLFVYIYASVNPIRATLIGLSALLVLGVVHYMKKGLVNPLLGALSIYSSALFGALLVQVGYLVSKSPLSGLVHALILVVTFVVLSFFYEKYWKFLKR